MRLRLGLALLLMTTSACSDGAGSEHFPGEHLQARVAAHLDAHRDSLRETLGHYALVYPVEPGELSRFAERLRVHPGPDGPVLGAVGGVELHGGGVLALLLGLWRPEGRAARLDDAFRFAPSRTAVSLDTIYAGYRRQLVLPEDGPLPRLALRIDSGTGGVEIADRDAYAFLGLLLEHEEELDRTWTTGGGQSLSVTSLLMPVWAHHQARPALRREPADHSELHLVDLLLAWARRDPSCDLEAVQARFLERDLDGPPPPEDAAEVLAHFAESLGLLLAEPTLDWTAEERRHARTWLAGLEAAAFTDLWAVPVNRLAHLARGLALVSRHRTRLE